MNFDVILEDRQIFSKMSELDIPETLHAQPEGIAFENDWVTGEGYMFDPLPGFHFGVCGPLHINAPIDSDFLYDTSLLFALLVLEGSCSVSLEKVQASPFNLQSNMLLVGKWQNQTGKVFIPAGQKYCHAAFLIEDGTLASTFGQRCAKEIMDALEQAAEKMKGTSRTITGIAKPDTIITAKHVLGMQRADGLDILRLRGACLGLFTSLFCNIAATGSAYYPMLEGDRIMLAKLKKRIEEECLALGSAADICAQCNMSFSKANNGFKHLYATTIAQYIKQCKMSHAYSLLRSRQLNVSECAFKIGYSNVSHFILAFKKHYGVTPKEVSRLQ